MAVCSIPAERLNLKLEDLSTDDNMSFLCVQILSLLSLQGFRCSTEAVKHFSEGFVVLKPKIRSRIKSKHLQIVVK